MSQPLWIDCASVADVGPPEQLAEQAATGHHVVLRFPSLLPDEKAALISRLSAALPDFSVFDSGGGLSPAWVTIKPVVARERVLERRAEIIAALEEYRRVCAELVKQYRAGTLSSEWEADEHGGHCGFTSRRTGQVVEAPFRYRSNPDSDDPYFFAQFVRTTTGLERVAEIINDDYHDAARILELVM